MHTISPLAAFILQYDALLQRYARFFIRDEKACALLVKDVFETWYELYSNTGRQCSRKILQQLTRGACNRYRHRWN